MKTIPVVLAAMMVLTNAWAKKNIDLTEFEGTYRGKGTIVASGMSYPLTGKADFRVSRKASSAKVALSGQITGEGLVPWGTTLKLSPNGNLSTSNIIGLLNSEIVPASGRFLLPKTSKLEGTTRVTVVTTTATQEVTMIVKPKGKRKKQLDVRLLVTVNGESLYTYKMTLTGR